MNNYSTLFYAFYVFFENPKKHDILRFFWVVANVFSNISFLSVSFLVLRAIIYYGEYRCIHTFAGGPLRFERQICLQ